MSELAHSWQQHQWGTAPEFVGPRHELRERLLLNLLLRARPGSQVLNVGAGQGSFSRLLEERGFQVTSTDLAEAAVEVLRRTVSGPVCRADATELPFEPQSFDSVVLGEVLEHVEDDSAALHEVRRMCVRAASLHCPSRPIPIGMAPATTGLGTTAGTRVTRWLSAASEQGSRLTLHRLGISVLEPLSPQAV